MRGGDSGLRLGGDEFVLVQNIRDENDVKLIANKALAALAKPFMLKKHRLDISCSIGICIASSDKAEPLSLVNNADHAMYEAKHQGGNCYQFYAENVTPLRSPASGETV